MSTEKKENKLSKFKIVRNLLAALNITDAGKCDNFTNKVVDYCKAQIDKIEMNKKTLELQFTLKLADLNGAIEDKKEALETSYSTIDLNRILTNADQKEYIPSYLNAIKIAETELEEAEDSLKAAKEAHEKEIKELDTLCALYKRRLEKVSEE